MPGAQDTARGHSNFVAHSHNTSGYIDYLWSHLQDVADRASEYATAFGASDEARLAGLLHDLGKYGNLFQERLKNPCRVRGIDHWSAGAWAALSRFKQYGIAIALAIQGHHLGLQGGDRDSLRGLDLKKLNEHHPLNLRLSEANIETLLDRYEADGLNLPGNIPGSLLNYSSREKIPASLMLDVRMLFSALVDADFIETEAHFHAKDDTNKSYRECGPDLEPDKSLPILLSYIEGLAAESDASDFVNSMRNDLLDSCLKKATSPPGKFTLTAPTGSGKTLSMLAFALKHASAHGLRRIVTVIPYLSIIEQTVKEYRKVFEPHFEREYTDRYILEHHSLAGTKSKQDEAEDVAKQQVRLLAENWDAPIVVTTSVQFLESLFANRSSACRKLHRLANSIILFDEVQTLPVHLAVFTLATLSHLTDRYGCTVVFSTATQPAFSVNEVNHAVRTLCTSGWQPHEVVTPSLYLFGRCKRTEVHWPDLDRSTSWTELADQLAAHKQTLSIVNLKRHALSLYDELEHRGNIEGILHLSTNMCPYHRRDTLEEVRKRLENGDPCHLVSTQCVEAGVDVDFPVVFRAFGPLDSIAQAAGRCNRNGMAEAGIVTVFVPEDESYPDPAYRQAASVARMLLKRYDNSLDIHDPHVFEEYYRELYQFADPASQNRDLRDAIKRLDFVEVADKYRVIKKDAINVLVAYEHETFEQLANDARENGLKREWVTKARPYSIGMFRSKSEKSSYLEPVYISGKRESGDWFIYLEKEHYDRIKGLIPPSDEYLIG